MLSWSCILFRTFRVSPCHLIRGITLRPITSVQFSRSVVSDCDHMDCSTPGLPVHHQVLEFNSDSCALSWWCHSIISSSVIPFSSCFQRPSFGLFQWVSSSHQVPKVLEFQLQHQSFQWIFRTDFLQDRLIGSPCSPRDTQEFSPTPQFKSINSSALSFLYSPTVTSIYDYWKNHNFD